MRIPLAAVALLVLLLAPATPAPKDLPKDQWTLQEKINDAIDRGVTWLRATQRKDGSWESSFGSSGATSLALFTLLASGVPPSDPAVKRAEACLAGLAVEGGTLQDVMDDRPPALRMTYAHSLLVLALTSLDAKQHRRTIQRSVGILVKSQKKSGQWAYIVSTGGPLDHGDNSNTQFALLALRHAALAGFDVPKAVWQRSYEHFEKTIETDGGWGYGCPGGAGPGTYGSMTAVGVASLVICKSMLLGEEKAGEFRYLRIPEVRRGLEWLEGRFAADHHPGVAEVMGGAPGGAPAAPAPLMRVTFLYYWLYAVERVGMLLGIPYLGDHDWYREGAERLVANQQADGRWDHGGAPGASLEPPLAATCFALLFLEKATRPVVTPPVREGR